MKSVKAGPDLISAETVDVLDEQDGAVRDLPVLDSRQETGSRTFRTLSLREMRLRGRGAAASRRGWVNGGGKVALPQLA